MIQPLPETLITTDHHCVLTAGGLMLIESEEIDEEMDADDIAAHEQTRVLSPDEALRIAAFVEQHRAYLEQRAKELDRYFTEVAQAWLDKFREPAAFLIAQGRNWWPEVFREARHVLVRLTNEETIPILTAWYKQLHQETFPRAQQEALLYRYFKRLYYERYPIPEEDSADEE